MSERAVVLRHGLKNALIPVVTLLGLELAVLISGIVIMESIFAIPGIGRLLLNMALPSSFSISFMRVRTRS